ncbi:MAG: beta-ketoacyl synthase N-terminal-like domain-containing protein [Nitrososphaerota archaeon]
MRKVFIAGVSVSKVEEHWSQSVDALVTKVVADLTDVRLRKIDGIFVASALAETLQNQGNLGAIVAEDLGLSGVPALRVEAGDASGAAALYTGYQSILSGISDIVLVVGVEKMSDASPEEAMFLSSLSERYDYVGYQGVTESSIAAMMYKVYLEKYELPQEMVAQFPVIMHENAAKAPHAQYQFKTTLENVLSSPVISPPLRRLETTAPADGAAAVLLCSQDFLPTIQHDQIVEIAGCATSTDIVFPFDREDPLKVSAASRAFEEALARAGVSRNEIKVLEIHDSYSILANLILESIGYSEPGKSGLDAKNGMYSQGGKPVINTFGGLKARGHPIGATGVYQAAEIYMQLTRLAGSCQVDGAQTGAMINLAGLGSAAYAFVMRGA